MSIPVDGFDSNTRSSIARLCRRSDWTCLSSQSAFRAGRKRLALGLRCQGQPYLTSMIADGRFSSLLRIYQVLVSMFSLAPLPACEPGLRIQQPPWFNRPVARLQPEWWRPNIIMTGTFRGILRRDATPTLSTAHPIIILKHELHSNWPVYSQHDRKETSKDGLTLVVERSRTCIGPGEQLELTATLNSESPIPFSFRGFDMTLRENVSFRAHPGAVTSKKANIPQARTTVIGDQKVPANVILHHGMQHVDTITCALPQSYNAMTVDAARLIDIRYMIHVSAVLEGGRALDLQIPLTISPFPRQYSDEVLS